MDNEIKEQKEQKVAEEYLSSLADLNMNSKPLINMLTILAEENIEYAAVIVKVVEEHIAKVHPDIKLPILYLIDSIVKNVKSTYIPLFSQCIVNIFCGVFEQVSEKVRERMYTLRQTWNEVFTAQKLYTLDVKVNCMDRNWPITAKVTKSPSIHVNPNFLKKNEMEATLRVKTRELLELEKRKLELELEATKKLLQEQEKQLSKQTESVKIAPEHAPQIRHPSMATMQKPNYIGINTYQKFRNNGPRQPPPQNVANTQQVFLPGVPSAQLTQQQKPKVHPVNPIMLNSMRHRDPRLARQQQQQQQQQQQPQLQTISSQQKDVKSKLNTNISVPTVQTSDQQHSNKKIGNSTAQGSSSYRNSKTFDSRMSKRRDSERSNQNRSNHDRSSRDRSLRDRSSKSRSEEEHSDGGSGGRSKSTSVLNRNKRGESRTRSESKSPTRARSSSTRSTNRSGSSSREKERRMSSKTNTIDRKKTNSVRNDSKYSSTCPKIDEETEKQIETSKRKTNSPTTSPSKLKDSKSKAPFSLKIIKTYAGRKHKPRTPSPNAVKDVDFRIIHPDKRARLTSLKNDSFPEEEKSIMPPPPPTLDPVSTKTETEENILLPEDKAVANIEKVSVDIDQHNTTATSRILDQKIATSSVNASNNSNNLDAQNEVKDDQKINITVVDADVTMEDDSKNSILNGKPIGDMKRPSTDDPVEPNAKRSKPQKIDGLFGSEDVDLRTVIPNVIRSAITTDMTPPPPPVISNEKENWAKVKGSPAVKLSSNKSSLDDVRAKLAKAARYNKIEKSQRELSQKFKIHELQDETTSQECNDNKIRTIIGQAQELLESRNINQDQYHNLVKTVMQINETNKLNAAKRLESLSSSEKSFEPTKDDARIDPDKEARENVHKKRIPKITKDSITSSPKTEFASTDNKDSNILVDENSQDLFSSVQTSRQIPIEKEKRVKISKWSAPPQQSNNNQSIQSQPQPQRQRFGAASNRPPFNNRMPFPSPWQNPNNVFNVSQQQSRRPNTTVPAPPQPPTLVIPKPCNSIDNPQEDVVRSITIDGRTKEIRFYENVAIVFMDWDQPREIGFQPGTRTITIDNKENIVLNFNEDYKEVQIDGESHKMRFAFPSRELYIDEHWYEVYFGGPAMPIPINNKIHLLQAEGPPPQVHIGILRRDLVVGKINMIVDARNIIPVFLDANPQTFTIDGQQHTIEFADNLKTVIINGELLSVEYGGLPKSLMLGGRKYFVRFGTLPSGIVAGQHVIKGMKYINMQPPDLEKIPNPIVAAITDKEEVVSDLKPVDSESKKSTVKETTAILPSLSTKAVSIPGIDTLLPNVNIDELFQKLISTGIINTTTPTSSSTSDYNKNTKEEQEEDEIKNSKILEPIKPINLNVPETIKIRQGVIINALFCGMQCSSCGVRFPPEQTIKYSQHLDWHFRQNRRERDSTRKAHSRKWYYEISDWLQYEEIEDLEDREKNFFESQQIDLENIDENSNQRPANSPIPSCPAEPGDVDRACDVCQEKFEQFYNEDQEEWHLRAATRVEDKIYHPLCYEDYKASLNPPNLETEEKDEDQSITEITIEDDNAVDVAIVKKENLEGSQSETQIIPDEEDDDDDDVIVVPAEEPSITEIDDDEEYIPVNMSREEMGFVAEEEVQHDNAVNDTMESDVEIQEPHIPFTDLDTYVEKHSPIDECSQSSLQNVKIKEEPKDDEDDDGFEDVGIVLIPEEDISIQSSDENTGIRTISSTVSTPQPSPIVADTITETSQSPSDEVTTVTTVEIPETGDSLEGNLESVDNSLSTTTALLGVNKIKINMTKNVVTSSSSSSNSNSTTKSISLNQNSTTCINNVSNISTIPVLCGGVMSLSSIPSLPLESSSTDNEENDSLFSGHSTFSAGPLFCKPISSATTETSSNVIQVITSHTTTGPTNMDTFANCIEVIGSTTASSLGSISNSSTSRENITPPLPTVLKPIEVEEIEPTFTFKPELQNVKLKKVKKIDCGVEASGLCSIM